jgi:predicted permease
MFTLVLTLQHAMPTAVNVHSVAAMHSNHEKVVATLLFWQYIACIVTIPISVTICLTQING